jgi:hypothetical protein
MPNPLTWWAHHFSLEHHSALQYLAINIAEVAVPCLLLLLLLAEVLLQVLYVEVPPLTYLRALTRSTRHACAIMTIALMLGIQSTGNYSFLNMSHPPLLPSPLSSPTPLLSTSPPPQATTAS